MSAQPSLAPPSIRMRRAGDGAAAYLVDLSPAELPPVPGRELEAAWRAASAGAMAARSGEARAFRFHRPDGSTVDVAVAGRDARCWAAAIDHRGGSRGGLHTVMGLALCIRLLALADLLARAAWASAWWRMGRDGADLHPTLLRAAASLPLTDDACFDEARFRSRLSQAPAPAASPAPGPNKESAA